MNDLLVGAPRGEVQGGLPMPGTEHVLTTVCGDAVATGAGSPGFLDQPVGGGCSFLLAPAGLILPPATLSGAGPGTGALELEGELPIPSPLASVHLQVLVADPTAAPGFRATKGLRVTIE